MAFHHNETFFDIRHFHRPGAVVGPDDVQIPHLCLENKHKINTQVYFYNHCFDPENFLDPYLMAWYTSPMASVWHKPSHFHPIWPLDTFLALCITQGTALGICSCCPPGPSLGYWLSLNRQVMSLFQVALGIWWWAEVPFPSSWGPENDLSWEERNPTSHKRILNMD